MGGGKGREAGALSSRGRKERSSGFSAGERWGACHPWQQGSGQRLGWWNDVSLLLLG